LGEEAQLARFGFDGQPTLELAREPGGPGVMSHAEMRHHDRVPTVVRLVRGPAFAHGVRQGDEPIGWLRCKVEHSGKAARASKPERECRGAGKRAPKRGLHLGTDMSRGQEREEDCHVRGHAERSGRVVEHPVRSHEDVGFGYRNNQRARRSGEPSRACEPTGAPVGWCDRMRGTRAARWHYGPALIREQSVFESTARPCADSLRACSPVAQMKLFRRRRTVTVYLDGRKALEFKRVRGPSGEYELDLVCRAGDVSDETVDRVREDIIRRWVWRDEER
jgi:hypothetical protein